MKVDYIIEGKSINLRSVKVEDADFILNLRLNENIKKYISKTADNIELQKKWIQEQIEREGDYYFLYEDKNFNKIGLISVYNIKNGIGETGRQISLGESTHNMEAEYLLYKFIFNTLNLKKITSTFYVNNKKAVSKGRKLGFVYSKIIKINEIDSYFLEMDKEFYLKTWKVNMEKYLKPLNLI